MSRRLGLLVAALLLAGCGTAAPVAAPTATPSMPTAPSGLATFYAQHLAWHKCGAFTCAWLSVPLDYAHPESKTIRLAVLKVPATDQAHKIGALVVNPGGPGASARQFAADGAAGYFRSALTAHYDIVGVDPRGVGASPAINCGNAAQTDAMVSANPEPTTPAQWQQANAITQGYLQRCQTLSGSLAAHVSTIESARDMDILRAALGQPRLDYFGASYGTFLGATYAGLFPTHVGRMVLDGALDPALSNVQMTLQQAHSMEVALRSYVANCVAQGSCFLGPTVDAGVARIRQLLNEVQAQPLPTGSSRPLTAGLAMAAIWAPLYVRDNWPQLTDALSEALSKHRGTQMLALADGFVGRGPKGYLSNDLAAQAAVNCLDHDDPTPWQQIGSLLPEFHKASPTFGTAFASTLPTCSFYPVQDHRRTSAIRAAGAPPIVVIGTTRDPVTPLAWARALASQLASGVLVTRNGDGHTAYHEGNNCIDNTVENYLVRGVVPRNGLAC